MNRFITFSVSVLMGCQLAIASDAPAPAPSIEAPEVYLVETPLTRKERIAFDRYHRQVRQQVEACANRGLLREQEINAKGSVHISYAIHRSGTLEQLGIRQPSGQLELDEVILRIMQNCSPVAPFPKVLSGRIEHLAMSSTMNFTSQPQRARLRWVSKPIVSPGKPLTNPSPNPNPGLATQGAAPAQPD